MADGEESGQGSGGFDLGADLASGFGEVSGNGNGNVTDLTPDSQPQNVTQATASPQTEFDPFKANWARLKDEDVPEQFRPLAKIGRTMNQNHSTAMAEVTKLRSELAERTQQVNAMLSQIQTAQRTPQAAEDARDAAQKLLGRYGYNPDSEGYAEAQIVYQIANELVGQAMSQHNPRVEQLEKSMNAILQHLTGQVQQTQQQAAVRNQEELNELTSAYSVDELAPFAQAVDALRGRINPATGQPFTYLTAYESVAGIAAKKDAEMRGRGKKAVAEARSAANPLMGAGGEIDTSGITNRSELEARVAQALGLPG